MPFEPVSQSMITPPATRPSCRLRSTNSVVVEQLVSQDAPYQLGLEAGSKPELLAAMTLLDNKDDALIVCNGYKDSEYITTAMDAQRLGINTYIVWTVSLRSISSLSSRERWA